MRHAIDQIVQVFTYLHKAGQRQRGDQSTVLTKVIPSGNDTVGFTDIAASLVTVTLFKEVAFPVNGLPALNMVCRAVVVSAANGVRHPHSGCELAVGGKAVGDGAVKGKGVLAHQSRAIRTVKAVVILPNRLPAADQFAVEGIIGVCVLGKQAGVLGLAYIDTALAKIIVVAVHLFHTGELFAVFVVGKAAVFRKPAFLYSIDERIAVVEGLVDITEASASVAVVIGIDIGVEPILFLVLLFLGKGVQTAGPQADVVADLTIVDHRELGLCIPLCILLGRQLDAADDAQGVSHVGIDGRGLIPPVQDQPDRIGGLIKLRLGQREVLVEHRQLAAVHMEVGIKVDDGRHLGQDADAFCQLQQEIPC